jgi:endonuclease/exonuclease/phosphatase (EEP) superfamily protein YafD
LKLGTNITTGKPKAAGLSIWGLVEVVDIFLCLATITGFLARLWWLFELTSHFRLHLAIALATIAAVWMLKRQRRRAVVCFAFATVNAALVFALFWPIADEPLGSGGRLRIVSVNVHTENERSDLLLEFLRGADADVVLLMEVNDRWMTALSPLYTNYPHRVADVREDNFGIALFSRLPLTNASVVEIGSAGVPSVIADVAVNEQTIHLVGTHPLPPGSSENARLRNEQMAEVANHVRNQQTPAIVFGDLNVTPWSPYFTDLLRHSGLKDTSQGRGLFGSWPAWLPFMRIPLDHCLSSPSIHVAEKHLGPQIHSDHLPVVIDLVITRGHGD